MTATNLIINSPAVGIRALAIGNPSPSTAKGGMGTSVFAILRQMIAKNRLEVSQQQGQFVIIAGQYANAAGETEKAAWQDDASRYHTMATQALAGAIIASVGVAITIGVLSSQGLVKLRQGSQTDNLDGLLQRLERVPAGAALEGNNQIMRPGTLNELITASKRPFAEFAAEPAELDRLKANIKLARQVIETQADRLNSRFNLARSVTNGFQQIGSAANDTWAAFEKAAALEAKSKDLARTTLSELSHEVNESIRKTLDSRQQALESADQSIMNSYRSWLDSATLRG